MGDVTALAGGMAVSLCTYGACGRAGVPGCSLLLGSSRAGARLLAPRQEARAQHPSAGLSQGPCVKLGLDLQEKGLSWGSFFNGVL